jgi:hypothetical protein
LNKTLNSAEEGTSDWLSAMSKMKKLLANVLGTDVTKLSDEFVEFARSSGLL